MKNFKIRTQLLIGSSLLVALVIVLGILSIHQNNQLAEQTETLFTHPSTVRKSIGEFRSGILAVQVQMKDILLCREKSEIEEKLNTIELLKSNAFENLDIIQQAYLGPKANVDSLKTAFIRWNFSHQHVIQRLRQEENMEQLQHKIDYRFDEQQTIKLFSVLQVIDDFAKNKAIQLYKKSSDLREKMNQQLITFILLILIFTIVVVWLLFNTFRKPIVELTSAAKQFHQGNLNSRSSFTSNNEFGDLSSSFNSLADSIQQKTELDQKFSHLAELMLSEYDTKKFFKATLNALAEHTGSQMAAIYLLSDDKKYFKHFESIGVDNNAREFFRADNFEGEFGVALANKKVNHIKNIPAETRFVFHTVSGKYIAREIITMPIIADNEIIAMISLSTINQYSEQSIQLIDRILVTLCARVEGILAYHKMKLFTVKLEMQNTELEAQKTEMETQASELIEQNTELEMQKKQLNEASRLKTSFLSNMSHELRTPLNSVIALSGVLNRRLANKIAEEEYSYIEVIERNGRHLLSLINDILDISRIEAGKEEIDVSKFNANNLIQDITQLIHAQANQKNIELIHKNSHSEIVLASDINKCRHILQNLIGNAIKFTERGRVEISAKKTNDFIHISVKDTGIGIEENQLKHIFEEFRQADGSTSRKYGGTGLGLSIAKKYANMLGGSIQVKSKMDEGSEFTLILPLYLTNENVELNLGIEEIRKSSISRNQTKSTNPKHILLVEDSEPAIVQLKDILEEGGYLIQIAHNGAEALQIIENSIPDAMILDLMMPDVDGFKVLETLRNAELTAHIPVLILTAKHISKDELIFLKRNNVHQLIQKGDIKKEELQLAVLSMTQAREEEPTKEEKKPIEFSEKPKVLIVEDNEDNLITVKALLSNDFTVFEALDGASAIEKAKSIIPDFILMDIALPGIDGIEAFNIIRSNEKLKHIPIIALTASAMTSDRETLLSCGFDAYIAKPIDEPSFFTTINLVIYGK